MMRILGKVMMTIAVMMILISGSICSAQKISVSDLSVENFVKVYNKIVIEHPNKINSIIIDESQRIIKNKNDIKMYFYPLRNSVNGNGTHIVFIVNKHNTIDAINITNNMVETKKDTMFAYVTVLAALGLTKEDINYFSSMSEPKMKQVSPKKILVIGFKPAGPNHGLDEIIILAFDKFK